MTSTATSNEDFKSETLLSTRFGHDLASPLFSDLHHRHPFAETNNLMNFQQQQHQQVNHLDSQLSHRMLQQHGSAAPLQPPMTPQGTTSFRTGLRNTPILQNATSPHMPSLSRPTNHIIPSSNNSLIHTNNNNINNNNNQTSQRLSSSLQQSQHNDSPQISYDYYNNSLVNSLGNDLFDDLGLQDWMDIDNANTIIGVKSSVKREELVANCGVHENNNNGEELEEIDDGNQINLAETYPLRKKLKTNSYNNFIDNNSDDRDATTTAFSSSNSTTTTTGGNSCGNERKSTDNRYGNCSTSRSSKDKYASRLLNSGEKTQKRGFFITPESTQNCFSNTNTLVNPIRSQMLFSECPTPSKSNSYKPASKQQDACEMAEEFEKAKAQILSNRGGLIAPSQSQQQQLNKQKSCGDDDEKAGGRNGLRILSKKVREIVCELKETTYKQVAESLIKDMEAKKSQGTLEFAKDEQNVKRRVYDALNVLIAANVLSKEGKKVKAEQGLPHSSMKSNISSSQNPLQKREYLKQALISKQERLERKQSTIDDLILKFVSLKSLCNRNAIAEQTRSKSPISSISSSQQSSSSSLKCLTLQQQQQKRAISHSSESEEEDKRTKLRFPFIGVYSPPDNSRLSFKKFSHGLLVSSVQKLNIQGDIDILVKLFTSRPNAHIFLQNEKRKFLSPALLSFIAEMDYFLQRGINNGNLGNHTNGYDNDEDSNDDHPNTLQMEVTITNNKFIERKQLPQIQHASADFHHNHLHQQQHNHNNLQQFYSAKDTTHSYRNLHETSQSQSYNRFSQKSTQPESSIDDDELEIEHDYIY